jgi:crotonobetainyl-CoA:carnitine CoA-transferase CaiB-like acyl-CoA transferase
MKSQAIYHFLFFIYHSSMQPFTHLKVLELANVLAGPSVGMFFAELGAQVIKIENKNTNGDITRGWKVASEDATSTISAYYHSINYGKTSLLLNLNQPEDLAIVHAHIADTDIVIANYTDAAAKRLQLDYSTLKDLNPRLIYAQLYAFADPSDQRPAFDIVLQAEAGILSMTGTPEAPARLPIAFIDILAGHQLKEAVLVALLERQQTGLGSMVSTSLMQTAIASLANQAANWLHAGHLPTRMGMEHPNIAPYGDTVQTLDNQSIVLAIGTEKQFAALCHTLDRSEWLIDPRFEKNSSRVQNRAALKTAIESITIGQNIDHWMMLYAQHGIPAGRIRDIKQVFEEEFAQEMILEQTEADGTISTRVKTVAWVKNK